MQLEREHVMRGDDGASLQHDAVPSAFSQAQSNHIEHIHRSAQSSPPQRSRTTPRILDGYHALGSQVSSTNSPHSLHIVWVSLADGAIDDMPGWRIYTGQSREQLNGDGWLDAIHPDDRQRIAKTWARARREQSIFQTAYRVRRHDGVYIAFEVRCVPVLRLDDTVQEWVWSYIRHLSNQPDATTGGASSTDTRHTAKSNGTSPARRRAPSAAAKDAAAVTPSALASCIPLFEAMSDAAIIYDTAGHARYFNDAARMLFGLSPSDDPAQAAARFTLTDAGGHPFAAYHSPVERIVRGAALTTADAEQVTIMLPGGHTLPAHITGAPLQDSSGKPAGAAVLVHEIHDDSLNSREYDHPRTALAALLALAEAVIFVSDEVKDSNPIRGVIEVPPATGQRLAALACDVIGCQRVSIVAVATENETLHPVAVAGLDASDERAWWERLSHTPRLSNTLESSVLERLRADQVQLIDVHQPPSTDHPDNTGVSHVLVVPMLIGEQLVGILTLDHGGAAHDYGLEEIALAGAVAKLAALVIERERLLHDSAEAQASVMALREAKRHMDEFLSIASHELRTPLTVIKANIQLLTRRIGQAARTEHETKALMASLRITPDFLDRTQRQIERLDRLVGDLLDISHIEAGHLDLHVERVDLCGVVREAVERQRSAWSDRTITLDLPDAPLLVDADPDRIGQVVTNYLTNALKYSQGDQHVTVTGAHAGDAAHVAVRDHGPGLTQEQRTHLWERFYRVSDIEVQSGSSVGLGLGLYISKTIIERHGGVTDVESAPGHGSTFWFTLPLAQPSITEE